MAGREPGRAHWSREAAYHENCRILRIPSGVRERLGVRLLVGLRWSHFGDSGTKPVFRLNWRNCKGGLAFRILMVPGMVEDGAKWGGIQLFSSLCAARILAYTPTLREPRSEPRD